jgi:hypothetical protein
MQEIWRIISLSLLSMILLISLGCGEVTMNPPDAAILPDAPVKEVIVTIPERCVETGWGVAYADIFYVVTDIQVSYWGFAALVNTGATEIYAGERGVTTAPRYGDMDVGLQIVGGAAAMDWLTPGQALGSLGAREVKLLQEQGLITESIAGQKALLVLRIAPTGQTSPAGSTIMVGLTVEGLPGRVELPVTVHVHPSPDTRVTPVTARFVCAREP